MSRTKAYIKGLTSTLAQRVLTKVIGLAVTPIVLSYLGKDDYGIWIIIGSFLGYMGLMDFGITGSVTQLIAKSDQKDQNEKLNTIVNNSFFLQVIIGIVIIVLGIVFSFFFPEWFEITPDAQKTAGMAFLLAAIGYGISFPPKTLKGLIRGKQQIALSVWLEFLLFILTTALNLYLLHLGFGLLALPIGTIVVRLISYAVFFRMAKRTFPYLHLHISYFKWYAAKRILRVSSVWFVGAMSASIIYFSDTLLIGTFIGTGAVTVYALTYRLAEFLREFIYTINTTAMPGLGQLAGHGELEKIRKVFFTMFPLTINITFSAVIFVYIFNKKFVDLWVGKDMYGGDILTLIFALTLFMTVVFHTFSIILSSGLNLKAVAITRSFEAMLNIIISLWLVHYYGVIGVAAGTVISSALTSFWIIPYFAIRFMEVSFIKFVKVTLFDLIPSLLIYTILLLGEKFLYESLNVFVLFLIWAVVSVLAVWFFALPKTLKEEINKKLNKLQWRKKNV